MTMRRSVIKRFEWWLLVICLLATRPSPAAPAYNVVLIVADDLGAHDLACTGSSFHETPNVDRLAAEGMLFTQAYGACTVCSPSRAALLTGRYPTRFQITDWIPGHPYPKAKLRPPAISPHLPLGAVTLAEWSKELPEYGAVHLGKWHLGETGFGPLQQGFDVNLGGTERGQPPSYFSPYQIPSLSDGPAGEYLVEREATEAVRIIKANRNRRFFLNYWSYAVHTPLQAKPELIAKHRARLGPNPRDQTRALYAAMIESLDNSVGKILSALDEEGIADQTIVIFTSDNGGLIQGNQLPTSNAPLRSGKGSPYEGGHRVPLLIRWPGITQAGSRSDEPVMGIDLVPTLVSELGPTNANANGNDARPGFDGVSLANLLRHPESQLNREALFWHYPHYHPGGARPYAAVRSAEWKLIQFYETGRHELYNLETDPGEAQNLADTQPERVMNLARLLSAWQNQSGARWPMPNPGWEAPALQVGINGPVVLHARDAFVHGEVLRYEPQPFKNTLGWWTRTEDWVSWTFDLPSDGTYSLEILQGCGNGSGGSEVEFTVGDARIVTTVIETGGFQSFTNRALGRVDLKAGRQTLSVKPLKKPGVAVMDLREVKLVASE